MWKRVCATHVRVFFSWSSNPSSNPCSESFFKGYSLMAYMSKWDWTSWEINLATYPYEIQQTVASIDYLACYIISLHFIKLIISFYSHLLMLSHDWIIHGKIKNRLLYCLRNVPVNCVCHVWMSVLSHLAFIIKVHLNIFKGLFPYSCNIFLGHQ